MTYRTCRYARGPCSHNKPYNLLDSLKYPEIIAGLIGIAFILMYGAIRIKKAGLSFASKSTIYSLPSLAATGAFYQVRGVTDFLTKSVHIVLDNSWSTAFCGFWDKIPSRLWNFYIKACLIPAYRSEWGKYKSWSFRSPMRPKTTAYLKNRLRQIKKEREAKVVKKRSSKITYSSALDDDIDESLPRPAPHHHAGCSRIRINVGGCIYETQTRTLSRYPHSVLGDPNKRLRYYNPEKHEYYFDRNRLSFETILYFYQSGGRFKRPENLSADILLDDAKFYGLPQSVIYQYLIDEGLSIAIEDADILPENLLMRKIWLLFDFPQSSMQAQILSLISILAITLSIATFCLETVDTLGIQDRYCLDTSTGRAYGGWVVWDLNDPFFFTETMCSIWFIVEYVVRLISSPVKLDFLVNTLNIIDLLAVLPFFVQITTLPDTETSDDDQRQGVNTNQRPNGSVSILRVVRLVRVFRIFKLSRHSRGLKILAKTLRASLNELVLLIFFVIIGVILFSSTMYFAELGQEGTHFESIPEGFWWALITITTVGYGDDVPKTGGGKIVGSLCAVAGVLTLALPVPVIVSNFNFFYHQAIGEADLSWIKISHTTPCPFRPMDSITGNDPSPYTEDTMREQKQQTGMRPSSIERIRPIEVYSSDEEFGELKMQNVTIKKAKDADAAVSTPQPTNIRKSKGVDWRTVFF